MPIENREIKQVGLRRTGTNVFRYVMVNKTNVAVEMHEGGFKHGVTRCKSPVLEDPDRDDMNTVLHTRNPLEWVLGLERFFNNNPNFPDVHYDRNLSVWGPLIDNWVRSNEMWLRGDPVEVVDNKDFIVNCKEIVPRIAEAAGGEVIEEVGLPAKRIRPLPTVDHEYSFKPGEVDYGEVLTPEWKKELKTTFIRDCIEYADDRGHYDVIKALGYGDDFDGYH